MILFQPLLTEPWPIHLPAALLPIEIFLGWKEFTWKWSSDRLGTNWNPSVLAGLFWEPGRFYHWDRRLPEPLLHEIFYPPFWVKGGVQTIIKKDNWNFLDLETATAWFGRIRYIAKVVKQKLANSKKGILSSFTSMINLGLFWVWRII